MKLSEAAAISGYDGGVASIHMQFTFTVTDNVWQIMTEERKKSGTKHRSLRDTKCNFTQARTTAINNGDLMTIS